MSVCEFVKASARRLRHGDKPARHEPRSISEIPSALQFLPEIRAQALAFFKTTLVQV
jgi:hypothetical protein